MGEPGNTVGGDFCNEAADLEMRSITSSSPAVVLTDFDLVSCAAIFCSNLEIASLHGHVPARTAVSLCLVPHP